MSDEIVSLDQYRARANTKHGDLPIPIDDGTTVVLRRPMRMSKDERRALFAAEKRISSAQQDHPEVAKARRVLKAAQDRRDALDPEKSTEKVYREHDRRVADAEAALQTATEDHPVDNAAQVDELIEGMHDMFRAIADHPGNAERLLAAVGDDVYVLQEIMADWRGRAEPGEAQPSPS